MLAAVRRPSARLVLTYVGLLVSLVCCYLVLRNIRPSETWAALRDSNYLWLIPAFLVFSLHFVVRAVRWRALFATERRPNIVPITKALFVCYFFNNVFPARAGEAARVVALRRLTVASVAETTATVVIERVYDVLSLLILLFVALPWLPNVSWLRTAMILAAVVTAGLVVAVVVIARFRERPFRFAFRFLRHLPLLPKQSIDRASENFFHGLAGFRTVRIGLAVFFWTTLSWLVLMVSFWLVMLAFDLDLSLLAGLFVVIAVGLSMILPSSPAALGVFEGATVVALGAYGIGDSRALSYALVLHALNVLPFIVIGIAAFGIPHSRNRAMGAEVE
jgi:uncharacterized protein (TIRG00374 family)